MGLIEIHPAAPETAKAAEAAAQGTGAALTAQDVEAFLQTLAPCETAADWDNVGLLVDAGAPVTGILCALDVTAPVVEEAVRRGCSLIAAHHPVIFQPLKRLSGADVPALLLARGVSAVCMHTNLDAAVGGVNDVLCGLLGVRDAVPFAEGIGRIGRLEAPCTPQAFCAACSAALGAGVKHTPCAAAPDVVRTVAVLGGSGGSDAAEAFARGADAYVTGEAAHHHAIAAAAQGRLLVAAGHFATEHPVVYALARQLSARFAPVPVLVSEADADPFVYD